MPDTLIRPCPDPQPHDPHDWRDGTCVGLTDGEPALAVACIDCFAPPGRPCETADPDLLVHAVRRDSFRYSRVEHGTCTRCHQHAVYGDRTGTGDLIAWHPDDQDAARCPRLPDPATDWNAFAQALQEGKQPGVVPVENFLPGEARQADPDLFSEL